MAPLLLLPLLLLVQLLGGCHTTTTTISTLLQSPSTPDDDPKWLCAEVSAEDNASVQQIVGDWWVLELDGTPPVQPTDPCYKLSFTDLHEEGGNSSSVTFTIYRLQANGSKDVKYQNSAYFLNTKANEFVIGDLNSVWRVHHLSADGRVLVLVGCYTRRADYLFWATVGLAQDDLPVQLPQRSANCIRRDANLCRELEEAGESTTSSTASWGKACGNDNN